MAWFWNVYEIIVLVLFSILKLRAQDLILMSRPPNVTYVELGETLTLNVTYQSTKKVVVSWTKDSKTLYSPHFPPINPRVSLKGQGSLILVNTTLLDNGSYEHEAKTQTLVKRIKLIAIIQVKPTANISCSSYQLLNESGNFECLCNSTGGNPPAMASWYRSTEEVSGPGYLKQTLSLKNISKENAGNYSCIVKSHDLRDTKQVAIKVQYKPGSIFFTNNQKENITSVGKSMRITCQADAFPEPNYIVSRNGVQLSNVVDGVMIINSVNISDAGRYECIANNFLGSASASFNLTVKVPPVAVTSCLSYVVVEEGRDFGCICNGKGGEPPPAASWYKVIDGSLDSKKSSFLKIVNREDAGNYSCIAKSENLNDTKQVEIVVHYKPTITFFKSDMNNVEVGKKVTITCKAVGFPPANYTIFYNSIKFSDVVDGVKTFKSVSLSNTGRYVCTAKNYVGGDSESINLIVKVMTVLGKSSGGLSVIAKVGIAIGCVFLFIFVLVAVFIWWRRSCKDSGFRKKLPAARDPDDEENVVLDATAGGGDFNPYESVDQKTEEPGTSDPVDPSSLPSVYAVVDKSSRKKKPETKPEHVTYASLDAVALQPDSSQMRDRTREETTYATIDPESIRRAKS